MLNKPSGNMYPWAYTWNPLAGKCPHECVGCYVGGKIAPWLHRMGNDKYIGEPRLIEKEFKTKLIVPEGYVIFVQSCGDLFAYGIPSEWIQRVLNRIREFPQTTFLLQTKNPERFFAFEIPLNCTERFFAFEIPLNCILGTTIETNRDYHMTKAPTPQGRYSVFARSTKSWRDYMVSIEPIMDFDLDVLVFWMQMIRPKFVSIGADSGNNNLPEPSPEKLRKLIVELQKFTEVRLKKNINKLLKQL